MKMLILPGMPKAFCFDAGKCLKLTVFAGLTTLCGVGASSADAAVWYLQEPVAFGNTISTPSYWYTTPISGTGTAATSLNVSDIYDTNGKGARTNPTGITNFAGGTIVSSGGIAGGVSIKGDGLTVANFQTAVTGGGIANAEVNVTFSATTMTLNGALGLANNGRVQPSASRSMSIFATTLIGSGDITLYGGPGGFVTLGFGNASGYAGTIFSTDQGFIDFSSSFATNGGLSLATGTRVQGFAGITVSFTSLDIGGTIVGPGTYTYEQLKALNATTAAIFSPSSAGPMGGTIIVVPEPSAWMLIAAAGTFFMVIRSRRAARSKALRLGV